MKSNRIVAATALAVALAGLWPETAEAQRRAVRVVRSRPAVIASYRPFYSYSPFFYDPWYGPYGPSAGFYGRYGWYGAYGYPQSFAYDGASLRLQIAPRDAEVYIDGYYAGTVDDFDGAFQRLRLERGDHELTVFREGYRTFTQKIFLQPGGTFRVRQDLVALQPGDVQGQRPTAPPPSANSGGPGTGGVQRRGGPGAPEGFPSPRETGVRPGAPERRERADNATVGTLSLRVQPGQAEIRIDGERWDGPDGGERLLVQLGPGAHRLDVSREGYRPYSAQVELEAGETTVLNIALSRN